VKQQAEIYRVKTILIEDKASGTQLIQDLIEDGVHGVTRYQPEMDKVMRMHSVTSTIENGFVHIPDQASWLAEYLHEISIFPNGRFDDQVDSTSQALDWVKERTSARILVDVIKLEVRHTPFASNTSALQRSRWNRSFDDGRW
jgi:predicted phage terminase large subunit-like protein